MKPFQSMSPSNKVRVGTDLMDSRISKCHRQEDAQTCRIQSSCTSADPVLCSRLKFLQIQVLKADEDVVNCVQPHPSLPLLATSGIESVVRLWSPKEAVETTRSSITSLISYNQERLKSQSSLFSSVTPRVMAVFKSPTISFSFVAHCRNPSCVQLEVAMWEHLQGSMTRSYQDGLLYTDPCRDMERMSYYNVC